MWTAITIIVLVFSIIMFLFFDENFGMFLSLIFLVFLVIDVILVGEIINGRALEKKIQMYEEENKYIEVQINGLVDRYMKYETDTYTELKGESGISLVSLYPELKSDALVEKQIDVYTSNNEKIKELKDELIDVSNYKWWVYFGK